MHACCDQHCLFRGGIGEATDYQMSAGTGADNKVVGLMPASVLAHPALHTKVPP